MDLKKASAGIVGTGLLVLGGAVAIDEYEKAVLPDHLKIKVRSEQMLAATLTDEGVRYFYRDTEIPIDHDEIERTPSSYTRKIADDKQGAYSYRMVAKIGWQYHFDDGRWFKVEHGTTTSEAFERQTKSVVERVVRRMTPYATADSISSSIASGGDDSYTLDASIFTNSATFMRAGRVDMQTNTRFLNVTIPPGATIDSANISYRAFNNNTSGGTSVKTIIQAEDADNATAPTSYADFNGRTMTTALVNWTMPSFTDGVWYDTPDFKSVVQEVVDRGGWSSGNALSIYLKKDATAQATYWRQMRSYEYATGDVAQLTVVYTASGGGDPTPTDGVIMFE
jgi:hypothetical protein